MRIEGKNSRFELLMYFDGNTLNTKSACKEKLLIGERQRERVVLKLTFWHRNYFLNFTTACI